MHAFGRLAVVDGLRRHLVDELVMLGGEPLFVALAVQRDRLPGRFAAGVDELVCPVQPVFGVLYGCVPNLLPLLIRDPGVLAEVLDAVS